MFPIIEKAILRLLTFFAKLCDETSIDCYLKKYGSALAKDFAYQGQLAYNFRYQTLLAGKHISMPAIDK